MRFSDIIGLWPSLAELATDIGVGERKGQTLVQAWKLRDSIPAEWFGAVVRAASVRGFHDVSLDVLSEAAERRRLEKTNSQIAATAG